MKVIITANNVSAVDMQPINQLRDAGYEVVERPEVNVFSEEELYEAVKDADIIFMGTEKYSAALLNRLDKLKMIARRGVGVDNIDLETLNERKIILSRTIGCVDDAVAELILSYILEVSRKISTHSQDMKNGLWNRVQGGGLVDKTIGFLGFGSIAKGAAKRAAGFKMNVLYNDIVRDPQIEEEYAAIYVDRDTLFAQSDFVSVNTPLTPETRGMINAEVFQKMKETAYIINTARGPIVNEQDLVNALENEEIAGACIDVFDTEPYTESPLRQFENVILTPHIATFTKETFSNMNNHCANAIIQEFGEVRQATKQTI